MYILVVIFAGSKECHFSYGCPLWFSCGKFLKITISGRLKNQQDGFRAGSEFVHQGAPPSNSLHYTVRNVLKIFFQLLHIARGALHGSRDLVHGRGLLTYGRRE